MKIAVIQIHSKNKKDENVSKAVSFVERAAGHGARFVLLPEVFTFRGMIRADKSEKLTRTYFMEHVADPIPGETASVFQNLARKHGIFILAGSIYERSADPERAYNTSILIRPDGRIAQSYRKIHLFNADVGDKKYRESDYFLAGDSVRTVDVEEFTLGMSICYDVRFPELYREYFALGADILSVPSAFTQTTGEAHWHALIRARAVENLSYVLAPNQTGEDNLGRRCYGHSLIVDPWGEILAEASGGDEEIIYAQLFKEIIKEKRRIMGQARGLRQSFKERKRS